MAGTSLRPCGRVIVHDDRRLQFPNRGYCLDERGGQIKTRAGPVADEWHEIELLFGCGSHETAQDVDQFLNRFVPAGLLSPWHHNSNSPSFAFGEIAGTFRIEMDKSGTDVCSPYVDGELPGRHSNVHGR